MAWKTRDDLPRPALPRLLSGDESPTPAPRVFITLTAYRKLRCFVNLCPYEINGLGAVLRQGNDFLIYEIFLLKQYTDANGVHVEIDDMALNQFIFQLVKNDGDPSAIRCQWHSHVNMPAYCSAENLDTIAGYMNDFMISMVLNKRGDCHCRLDIFKPVKLSLETPLSIVIPAPAEEIVAACCKEMEKNVVVRRPFLSRVIRTKGKVRIVESAKEITVPLSEIEEAIAATGAAKDEEEPEK